MGNQPASTRFRARFESALHAYQETTGVILVEHPLAMQLKNSHSVDSFTTLLRHEARAFSDLQGSDTIMKLIESTVSILYTLSATASFGEANGLVRQNVPMGCSTSLMNFCSHSHRQRQYLLASLSYLPYVLSLVPTCVSMRHRSVSGGQWCTYKLRFTCRLARVD